MRGAVAVALCALAGCIEPELVLCESGLACPVGTRCDEVHHTCVSPDQLSVCQDREDDSDCTAGPVSGGCFDGVCLPRGCGNRVVEAGEMCDDGNQISLDGCRSDCLSTEICGNGFLDPEEPCDDGDLVSRDGCDSRCQLEEATWTVIPIAPAEVDSRRTAFDAARGRLVSVAGGTWEWDGTRWTVDPTIEDSFSVFYDPDRQEVRMLRPGPVEEEPERRMPVDVHAWRDGRWVQVSRGEGPDVLTGWAQATYDPARHQMLAVADAYDGPASQWTLDSTDAWTRVGDAPELPGDAVLAFDPATGHVLAQSYSGEWMYDGATWTESPSPFEDVSIGFDPVRGRLILVDRDRTTYERIGTEWQPIAGAEMPCGEGRWSFSAFYYNPDTSTLDRFSRDASEICRWNGAWTSVIPEVPTRISGATYDPVARSFALFNDAHPFHLAATETWTFAGGGWSRIETSDPPVGRKESLSTYSHGRAATILYGGRAPFHCEGEEGDPACELLLDAWSFDGTGWAPVASPPLRDPFSPVRAATYDGERGRVVLGTLNEIWSLADTDDEWREVTTDQPALDLESLAWHARNGSFLVARRILGAPISAEMFDFSEVGWARVELVPSVLTQWDSQITLLSDFRKGSVLALDTFHGAAWERVGTTWSELPSLPMHFLSPWSAYNPVDGSVLVVGINPGSGRYAAIMTRSSATPLESCSSGEDLDGDGLSGCDDPECFWACSSCLPHTTCP